MNGRRIFLAAAVTLLAALWPIARALAADPPPPTAIAFIDAVKRGDFETARTMLADMPSLATHKFKYDVTALHAAALTDEPRTVELLLKRGAYVDARGGEQKVTPLFLAVMKGHGKVARTLIERRADPNARGMVPGDEGFDELRPLHLAAVGGYTDIADLLVQRGAILSAASSTGSTALDYAKRTNNLPIALMLDAYSRRGLVRGRPIAALLCAIAAHDSARADTLLDAQPSLGRVVLDNQWTPLHLAAWTGSPSVCDVLIEHGADLRAEEAATHWTPALRAYDSGHTELCEYLRRRDATTPARGAR